MTTNTQPGTSVARRPEGGMVRWSPWEEVNDLRLRMDELFGRAFGYTPLHRLIPGTIGEFEPQYDLYETNEKVIVYVALPGFTTKDINLEVTPDQFTVSGERKAIFEDEKATTHRMSGLAGTNSFSICHSLPVEIDPNSVKATFNNGVLQIEFLKSERARVKSVKVNVQG